MILMRLNKVLGVCEIAPYNEHSGKLGGWFPIDSLNFGFNPQGHDDGQQGGSGNGGGGGGRQGAGGSPRSGGGGGGGGNGGGGGGNGGGGESKDFTEMQITKAVDMSTVNLMQLAMEARGWSAGNEMAVVADIHFIGSVHIEKNLHTFTFLRIHLDGVEVEEWGIQSSGDDRPTESFKLVYEKAAICYETTDGRTRLPRVEAGWDQTNNKLWSVQTEFYPNFPKSD